MDAESLIKGTPPRAIENPDAVRATIGRYLGARPEVSFAYLYGSFVAGLPCRDIDVGIFVDEGRLGDEDPWDWETRWSAELTRAVGIPVDVRVLNRAPVGFQHGVLQGEALLVGDEVRLGDFIERVAGDYMEFEWLGRQYLREVLGS